MKKDAMVISYNLLIEKHIKEAARMTEMTRTVGNGNVVPVEDEEGLAASLLENHDELNIKRACFILYFSNGLCYTTLFRKTFFGYFETGIMNALNMEYREGEDQREKGCVMMLGAREWNKMITRLKRKLKGKKINFYKNSQVTKNGRNQYAVFYLKRGEKDTAEEEEVCGLFGGVATTSCVSSGLNDPGN
jgi:hypothetical protein